MLKVNFGKLEKAPWPVKEYLLKFLPHLRAQEEFNGISTQYSTIEECFKVLETHLERFNNIYIGEGKKEIHIIAEMEGDEIVILSKALLPEREEVIRIYTTRKLFKVYNGSRSVKINVEVVEIVKETPKTFVYLSKNGRNNIREQKDKYYKFFEREEEMREFVMSSYNEKVERARDLLSDLEDNRVEFLEQWGKK